MTLIETYRGFDIHKGLKAGREMYITSFKSTFTLESARSAIDRPYYTKTSTPTVVAVFNHSLMYCGVNVPNMGGLYKMYSSIKSYGGKPYPILNLQVL